MVCAHAIGMQITTPAAARPARVAIRQKITATFASSDLKGRSPAAANGGFGDTQPRTMPFD
jgi:hypothetical protein